MARPRESLSLSHARRVALGAQGFNDPIPRATPDRRALRRVVGRTGCSRSTRSMCWPEPTTCRCSAGSVRTRPRCSRRPPIARRGCSSSTGATRRACSPSSCIRCCAGAWTNAREHAWGGMRRIAKERPDLLSGLLADITSDGPLTLSAARASGTTAHLPRRTGPWWDWSDVKRALEFLFWAGEITTAERRGFERAYDLPERVLPAAVWRRRRRIATRRSASCCVDRSARWVSRRPETCATTTGCRPPTASADPRAGRGW